MVGGCSFQWFLWETRRNISLELMTIEIHSLEAETVRGVRVSVTGVCQIKVDGIHEDTGDKNVPKIKLAAQHFLGRTAVAMGEALTRTMEGHQRQILGTLTVEELYKDRAAFSQRVRDIVHLDLQAMGFKLVSYTVSSITDSGGYMSALGATQTSLVKREAAEGTAKNMSEARKQTVKYQSGAEMAAAVAMREAYVSVNLQKEAEAEADRNLNLKRALYEKEVNQATAVAGSSGVIEKAKQEQQVVREMTLQALEKVKVMVEVAVQESQRVQKVKEGESLAILIEQRNKAEAIRALAGAESDRIRLIGTADAIAILAKGEAEADVLRKKADAYKEYGEAAIVQTIVDQLPSIAQAVSAPLAKTQKMVFISSDGAAGSRLTQDVVKIVSEMPEVVDALTGVDFKQAIRRITRHEAEGVPK